MEHFFSCALHRFVETLTVMIHTATLNDPENKLLNTSAYFTECPLAMPVDREQYVLSGTDDLCDMTDPANSQLNSLVKVTEQPLLSVFQTPVLIP